MPRLPLDCLNIIARTDVKYYAAMLTISRFVRSSMYKTIRIEMRTRNRFAVRMLTTFMDLAVLLYLEHRSHIRANGI